MHLHAAIREGFDAGFRIRDEVIAQTAGLLPVTAHIALHADTVDQLPGVSGGIGGKGVDAFHEGLCGGPFCGIKHIIVIIEQANIRTEGFHGVTGKEEGVFHIIRADVFIEQIRGAAAGRPEKLRVAGKGIAGTVTHGLVDHIPAVNGSGEFLLKMRDDLGDIGLQTGEEDFPGGNGLRTVIALMEEPVQHIGIPDQHMAPDADTVLPRPENHPIREGIIHPGHAVPAVPAGILIQERIGLGLVGAGGCIKLGRQQIEIRGIPELIRAETDADPEAGSFRQILQGRSISAAWTGGNIRRGREKRQRQYDGQKKAEKHFQTDHPFPGIKLEPLYHGSAGRESSVPGDDTSEGTENRRFGRNRSKN